MPFKKVAPTYFFLFTILIFLFNSKIVAAPFTQGNVFVSTGVGTVLEYTPTGTLVQTLNVGTSFITGSTFDSSGNFYVTRFSNNQVQKFDNLGVNQGTFGGGYSTPESVVINASGDVFVGSVGGGIRQFDSTGILQSSFITGTRIDFMDLAADQKTMYYTQEGGEVHRVDLSTNTILSDFSTAVENAFALRILANGSVLVADGSDIELLDSSGNQIMTYDSAGHNSWFGLNLDPDGTTFWSADFSGHVSHFDLATGAVIDSWDVAGVNGTWGLAIYGEITQGGGGGGGTVPEPITLALFGIGLLGMSIMRRFRSI